MSFNPVQPKRLNEHKSNIKLKAKNEYFMNQKGFNNTFTIFEAPHDV